MPSLTGITKGKKIFYWEIQRQQIKLRTEATATIISEIFKRSKTALSSQVGTKEWEFRQAYFCDSQHQFHIGKRKGKEGK